MIEGFCIIVALLGAGLIAWEYAKGLSGLGAVLLAIWLFAVGALAGRVASKREWSSGVAAQEEKGNVR